MRARIRLWTSPGHGATVAKCLSGSLPELVKSERSLTGQYLSDRRRIEIPKRRVVGEPPRPVSSFWLKANWRQARRLSYVRDRHATRHNLKNLS